MLWKIIYRILISACVWESMSVASYAMEFDLFSESQHIEKSGYSDSRFALQDTTLQKYVVIEGIEFSGNHKTRSDILLREIEYGVGDTLLLEELEKLTVSGRQNLMNTQLFNFVEKTIDTDGFPKVVVRYAVVERWYTWPFPIFEINERNLNDWIESPSFSKLNYGISVVIGNFGGRNERFTLQVKMGYMQKYSLFYRSPYFNKAQNLAWGVEGGMERSREMAYLTEDNQQLFYKSDAFVFRKNFGQFYMYFRPGVYGRHSFHLGVHQFGFADTLKLLNPRFVPGDRSWFNYVNVGYEYIYDRRDARAYPLRGHYMSVSARRLGMGLLDQEKMDANVILASLRTYRELSPRWFFASGLMFKWSDGGTMSYFNQQGLGFASNLVRGYQDYVIDGQSFMVIKTSGKYELLPKRTGQLGFIRSEKFSRYHYALYLNAFVDAGYAYDRYFFDNNPLNNKILAGGGFGIDFVTYYDKVFRTELTVNRHGEVGLFFHLMAPF